MSKPAIFLDSFSGAVADLPKGRRSADDVLAVLKDHPRVSCFDMSEARWICNIIGDLKASGRIESLPEPYPWLRFKVLEGKP